MKHRMLTANLAVVFCLVVATAIIPALESSKVASLDIGSRRELLLDGYLVDRLAGGAQLRLHHPVPREIVMVHDSPWEGNASAYHSIFQDGSRYRMYYRAWRLGIGDGKLTTSVENLCYAESADGIHWRKPELGLHEFEGSKANNIVLRTQSRGDRRLRVGGPAVFRDENPNVSPQALYKTFLISSRPLGMLPFQSPDGIHWSPLTEEPVITHGAFDSRNLAFWDSQRGVYRAYWRYFTGGTTNTDTWKPAGVRAVRTAVSKDLLHWENQADLRYPGSPEEQLYENGIKAYHRAPHLLIGFPVRYIDRGGGLSTSAQNGRDGAGSETIRGWPASLRALPDPEARAARAALSERYGSALTEGILMASRDGVNFKRWNEAFLRPGIERSGTWNYGHQYIAWHLVETAASLSGAPNELSLYATEGYWTGQGTALRRYTLRLDGFVSAQAPMSGGELLTIPVTFSGKTLNLNFATSAAGAIGVELQDAAGKPMPGYTIEDCDELFGDTVERTVTWRSKSDVSPLRGQPVRLRFVLRDADLFSFQFRD